VSSRNVTNKAVRGPISELVCCATDKKVKFLKKVVCCQIINAKFFLIPVLNKIAVLLVHRIWAGIKCFNLLDNYFSYNFRRFRKIATINFLHISLSVRPSVRPHETGMIDLSVFRKSVEKIQVSSKLSTEWEIFQTKFADKIKTHILLGALTKLRKANISFVIYPSARLSIRHFVKNSLR